MILHDTPLMLFGMAVLFVVALAILHFVRRRAPARVGLQVVHTPNPSNIHTSTLPEPPPFPFVWFYRTKVTNIVDRPLQVVQFECYFRENDRWVASNILRRDLTTDVFVQWYQGVGEVVDGWLQPGACAVCAINWHGREVPYSPEAKWVYYAVDKRGERFKGEASITSIPYRTELTP